MPKLSQASIRREVSEALRPLKVALHAKTDGVQLPTVDLRGFRFTACRLRKAPGQIGYVWKVDYTGRNADGYCLSGGIAEVADGLYWYLKKLPAAAAA